MKSISTIVLQVIILVLTLQLSQAQDVLYPKWTTPTAGTGGVYTRDWPYSYGNYTVKAWYLPRPNDGQNGQTGFSYTGPNIDTQVTLGPNY